MELLTDASNIANVPSRRIGTMRIDWYDGRIANKWFPTEYFDTAKIKGMNVAKVQEEVNEIIFHKFLKYENVLEACEGHGYHHSKQFYCKGEQCDFSIKLNPVITDYSYVYIYYRE